MSLKVIATYSGELPETRAEHRKAVVLRDEEWDEYRVRFYLGGKHQRKADYHTTDESDARGTAAHWVDEEPEDAPATAAPRTIDMTPTWTEILGIYLAVLQDGNEQGRSIARLEMRRMAEAADKWNSHARSIQSNKGSQE
jgi:hypothetical protein